MRGGTTGVQPPKRTTSAYACESRSHHESRGPRLTDIRGSRSRVPSNLLSQLETSSLTRHFRRFVSCSLPYLARAASPHCDQSPAASAVFFSCNDMDLAFFHCQVVKNTTVKAQVRCLTGKPYEQPQFVRYDRGLVLYRPCWCSLHVHKSPGTAAAVVTAPAFHTLKTQGIHLQ